MIRALCLTLLAALGLSMTPSLAEAQVNNVAVAGPPSSTMTIEQDGEGYYVKVLVQVNYSSNATSGKYLICRYFDPIAETWNDMYFSATYPGDDPDPTFNVPTNYSSSLTFEIWFRQYESNGMYEGLTSGYDLLVLTEMKWGTNVIDSDMYWWNDLPE